MWVLEPEAAPAGAARFFITATSGTFTIGRPLKAAGEPADIVLAGDASISKVHCEITISNGGNACTLTGAQKAAPRRSCALRAAVMHQLDCVPAVPAVAAL